MRAGSSFLQSTLDVYEALSKTDCKGLLRNTIQKSQTVEFG